MPVLQAAQSERPDVNFVFLNQGEAAVQVQSYLNGQQLVLQNVLLDARGEVATQLGHRALPTTLFFDARGRLIDTRVGELSRATLAQRLAGLSTSSGSP
jgi:thioredoxin-like negative regulator of GroEL